jgi:hypothetical protein
MIVRMQNTTNRRDMIRLIMYFLNPVILIPLKAGETSRKNLRASP